MADRYANSNVVRQPSLSGIAERANHFVKLCADAIGGSLDLYVSKNPSVIVRICNADERT